MENLLEELIIEIKKDARYQAFLVQEQRMLDSEVQMLLKEYQAVLQEYQDTKEYAKYIDIETLEEKVKEMKQKVARHPIIKEYYQAYHQINEVLEEVTKCIFKDISEDLITSKYAFIRGNL